MQTKRLHFLNRPRRDTVLSVVNPDISATSPVNLGFLKFLSKVFFILQRIKLGNWHLSETAPAWNHMPLPARATAWCNDSTGRHPEGGRLPSVETARGLAQKHRFVLTSPPPPPRRLPDHHTFGPYINTPPPHLGRLSIPPPPPLACT